LNLLAEAPLWCMAIFGALLSAASIQDAVQFRISNLLTLAVLLLAIVAAVVAGPEVRLWQNLAIFAALLTGGTLLFSAGKLGGGDVKLLAATGVWVNFRGSLSLLAAVFIAGGVLAVLLIVGRSFASERTSATVPVLRKGAGIPYGIAIAIGALVATWLARS
jgi:prepilin peptidase CpaA